MSDHGTTERAGAAVLERAVSLLDALAEHGEMRPADLAALLDEPRSTVYRLLATMRELGLVEPGQASGTHRLGMKLVRLGGAALRGIDLRRTALPVMERIHAQLGETIFLCLRRGWEAVCVERIEGARVQVLAMRLGDTLPLHLGGAPRALLAFEPTAVWDEYLLAHPELARLTANSLASAEHLLAELEATRARGYAVSDEDVTDGIAAVGAPIFDHTGAVVAALSLAGIRAGVLGEDSPATALIVDGAREISESLGYEPKESQPTHA